MTAIIADPALQHRLIQERKATGADKYDEVWEGVYLMSPMPNNQHQDFVNDLDVILTLAVKWAGLGRVQPGANVSDRDADWEDNFRCPDILVFLNGNTAEDRESHWFGGPDFAIEIASQGDRSYEKLAFYASVNTSEVLIVDRHPWQLVLFRRQDEAMVEVGRSTTDDAKELKSNVVPLTWKLAAGEKGPQIEVVHHDGQQRWTVKSVS